MKKVVDASVAVKWYIPEIFEREANRVQTSGEILHAPELILPEFSNIIWKKVRFGEITEKEGNKIVDAFAQRNLHFHSHKTLIKSAFTGAVMTNRTVYDWTYLSLAIALSCEFITADEKFYKALENTKLKKHLLWIGDV
ncbi:MAG: type II toxin-antitoxin system VapC family toxin [Pyrinomonadaceae bacterium]